MREARLPLVTLYLTERCNSRCVTCDYWRHGRNDTTLESVLRLLPDLRVLGTRVALLSGGEPLLNPEWPAIARSLRAAGLRLWLLTSGLALAKHALAISELFDTVTVSLDGANAPTYRAIRGLDAFDKVCEGIAAAVAAGTAVSLRVTLQRANYQELPQFITLARELGVRQVSFLAVDVGNAHAFARTAPFDDGLALRASDLEQFGKLLAQAERDHAAEFATGFIAESPAKLRRIQQYFAALNGAAAFPPVRCNAPEFSAVIGVDGSVAPCFFIPGPGVTTRDGVSGALLNPRMSELRATISAGGRPECERCVCSMWRDPAAFGEQRFALPELAHVR